MTSLAVNRMFGESRYMLTQGRLTKAATFAAKMLATEPEGPLWLFVSGSIEAAQFWVSKGNREAALETVKRIFEFPGPYELGNLRPDQLEQVPGALAQQLRTAALERLTNAGLLANGQDAQLIKTITLTARELDNGWTTQPVAPAVLVSEEICLLDISIERAMGVAWINDLPRCPIVMLKPHWARLSSAKPSTVARKLRDALIATKRFREAAMPADLGKGADPILDQLWRRGSESDIVLVTANAAQVGAADGLRVLSDKLPDPQRAPIKRKLKLVKPAAKLPVWPIPNKSGGAPSLSPLPQANEKPPLFSPRANEQVFVDLTPIKVAGADMGDVLNTSGKDYRRLVSAQLGFGGEGGVYLTDSGDVCKVYQPEKATVATEKKLQLMVKRPIGHPLICWPTELVSKGGVFVGYLMPRARGQIMRNVTNPEKILTVFPNWKRQDLAKLALKVCEVVEYLHKNNILVGDLSDTNIMVDEMGRPWFIDTDSYQLGSFPSPVGRRPFIHPDLLGADLKQMFRHIEHEWFALATLIFMILFPGRPPYAGAGADNQEDDHRDRVFPYRIDRIGDPRLDQRESQLGPPWTLAWSNLSRPLRLAFSAVFRLGKEKRAALDPNEEPYDATFWRKELQAYIRELDGKSSLSKELFPTRYPLTKLKADEERRVCERCKEPFNAPRAAPGGQVSKGKQKRSRYCLTCLNTLMSFPCEVTQSNGKPCKRKFLVRFRELDEHKRKICTFHQTNPP